MSLPPPLAKNTMYELNWKEVLKSLDFPLVYFQENTKVAEELHYLKLCVAFYFSFQRNQGINILSLITAFICPTLYILYHYAVKITSTCST